MKYKFTTALPKNVCKMCGKEISKNWSNGGVGAVCKICFHKREALDLVELGIIRNIVKVKDKHYSDDYTYTFEAKIDDLWYKCSSPCGNWSSVDGYMDKHNIFSVPVGHWELQRLYYNHFAN